MTGEVQYRPARAGRSPARRRGLSLIEVLLSLAIFLLALTALGRLIEIGTDSALDASGQSNATRLAQSKLAEAECGLIPLTDGGSGTFEDEPGYEYNLETTPRVVPNLYTVTVTVTATGRPGVKARLTQMMMDPQAMGGATAATKPTATTTGTGP